MYWIRPFAGVDQAVCGIWPLGKSRRILNILKTRRMRTVPDFVPELCKKVGLIARKLLKIIWIVGEGRGNRTSMELLPTDFESIS
jgi:hypothetical protein